MLIERPIIAPYRELQSQFCKTSKSDRTMREIVVGRFAGRAGGFRWAISRIKKSKCIQKSIYVSSATSARVRENATNCPMLSKPERSVKNELQAASLCVYFSVSR